MLAGKRLPGVLQNWLDRPPRKLAVVMSGSSRRMMRRVVLDAGAPVHGRAMESLAIGPLRAGFLVDAFDFERPWDLVGVYALWGAMPRCWELAAPSGNNRDAALDALVFDPFGPLHRGPDRLLRGELPPATALRPLWTQSAAAPGG